MEEETCGDCRSWEKEIYWTRFQYTHFYQFLHPGFDQRLAIPEKFSKNLKKKLGVIMTLKGPGGGAWNVQLTTSDDVVYLSHGWEEFVKDHFLQEKDLLFFKYNGDSHFDVLMFDGQSLCEKEASYFVRKCGHREHGSGCQSKRKLGERSVEDIVASPQDVVGGEPPSEKSVDNDVTAPPIISTAANKKIKARINSIDPTQTAKNDRNEEPSTSAEEIETKPNVELMSISPNVPHSVPYVSSGRLVTAEEKQIALQLAQAALSNAGFIVVMKPTHVYRKFYMVIPSGWITRHLSALHKQDVILRINENTWHTKFYYQKERNSGGLSAGWRHFAMDNNLQEFDVLVFEPGSPVNNSIVLDVNIFRVVQDVTRLTRHEAITIGQRTVT